MPSLDWLKIYISSTWHGVSISLSELLLLLLSAVCGVIRRCCPSLAYIYCAIRFSSRLPERKYLAAHLTTCTYARIFSVPPGRGDVMIDGFILIAPF